MSEIDPYNTEHVLTRKTENQLLLIFYQIPKSMYNNASLCL